MTATVRLNAAQFCTTIRNVLAFMPANSEPGVARVRVGVGGVQVTGTDTYAAGRDMCPAVDFMGEPATVMISRQHLKALDDIGLKDKKSLGEFTISPDGFSFRFLAGTLDPITGPIELGSNNPVPWDMYAAIDEMLETVQEFRTAFQPQLLSRFAKVTADKSERVADVALDDPEAPVLVKIGTTFTGLIMPVTRDVHAKNIGEEGLW